MVSIFYRGKRIREPRHHGPCDPRFPGQAVSGGAYSAVRRAWKDLRSSYNISNNISNGTFDSRTNVPLRFRIGRYHSPAKLGECYLIFLGIRFPRTNLEAVFYPSISGKSDPGLQSDSRV